MMDSGICVRATQKKEGTNQMKPLISILGTTSLVCTMGIAPAQTPPATVDGYLAAAKIAAGTDWAGTVLRLCVDPSTLPEVEMRA